ncbi:hypothetical protein ACFWZY_01720 [Streptomyces sp. NPDC058992]|uniref:hypothetical protein n=1 Tax=Streptomyces sp. NPDC058992 TaxID=3346688 RepID=UPI0036968544
MTTHTTEPAAQSVAPIETDDDGTWTPQDAFMHAMAAGEAASAALAVGPPRCLSVRKVLGGGFEVDLQFSEAPSQVKDFATAFDVPVERKPHGFREDYFYTEAHAVIRGIPVHAWTLTAHEPDPEDEADPEATVETPAPAATDAKEQA